jgi:lipoate-protein ligase B
VLLSPEDLRAKGMTCIRTERGGDVTYHGPGQLVGYPIVRVPGQGRDVKALVRGFEEVLLRTLARFGIPGRREPKNPGVWVGKAKIGSIGISVQQGVAFHGFSLNVNMDLTPFSWIQPCGHPDLAVTSLRDLLRKEVSVPEVKEIVVSAFLQTLSYRSLVPQESQAAALGLPLRGARFEEKREDRADRTAGAEKGRDGKG